MITYEFSVGLEAHWAGSAIKETVKRLEARELHSAVHYAKSAIRHLELVVIRAKEGIQHGTM